LTLSLKQSKKGFMETILIQSENRPKKPLRNTGRTHFKPGNCANPGGRPKGLASMIREQTKDGLELVKLNLQIMRGELKYTRKDADGNPFEVEPTIADRQKAIEYLTDRGFGKAIDLKADVTPDNELKELAKAFARELVTGTTKAN
jgi:hypothetical protein